MGSPRKGSDASVLKAVGRNLRPNARHVQSHAMHTSIYSVYIYIHDIPYHLIPYAHNIIERLIYIPLYLSMHSQNHAIHQIEISMYQYLIVIFSDTKWFPQLISVSPISHIYPNYGHHMSPHLPSGTQSQQWKIPYKWSFKVSRCFKVSQWQNEYIPSSK